MIPFTAPMPFCTRSRNSLASSVGARKMPAAKPIEPAINAVNGIANDLRAM